jgi:hypothetical protein
VRTRANQIPHNFPDLWKNRALTAEAEAKAKELAVLHLLARLKKNGKQ